MGWFHPWPVGIGLTRLEFFKCLLSTKRHCFALTLAFTSRHLTKNGKPFKTKILQGNLLKPPTFFFNTFCRKPSNKQVDPMMQIVWYWIFAVSSKLWEWLKKQAQTSYPLKNLSDLCIQRHQCSNGILSQNSQNLDGIQSVWHFHENILVKRIYSSLRLWNKSVSQISQ